MATTLYDCLHRPSVMCTRNETRKRAKCGFCGSPILARSVAFGVFEWRGDGRYPEADAVRVFGHETAAVKHAATGPNWVVREVARC